MIIILYNKYIQIDQKHCVMTNIEFNRISQSMVYVSMCNVMCMLYVCVCMCWHVHAGYQKAYYIDFEIQYSLEH